MIERFNKLDLRMTDGVWSFAEERRADIDAHWAKIIEKKPELWDGRVLGTRSPRLENGTLTAELVETRFAAFLAWRDWDFPDKGFFNLFGSAVIAGSDGGYLFGVMAGNTANAGAIYPCAGSLEPADVTSEGVVDLWASVERELYEEAGLRADQARTDGDFLVRYGQLLSANRVFCYDMPLAELADLVKDNIAAQDDPELKDVAVLRRFEDLDLALARPYAVATARYLFGA